MIDLQINASDLMNSQVLTLQADARITEAVQSLEEFDITGAPVLDAGGNLVGVLTVSDVARSGHVRRDGIHVQRDFYIDENLDRDDFTPEGVDGESIGDWMTPRVISVSPSASLKDVCDVMARESVHRVMVVERSQLLGIITSMDIVRHLANKGLR